MNKPLVIQINETKKNITESVQSAIHDGIPCFLLEPIIAELHRKVSEAAQMEYARAQKQVAEEEAKKQAEQEKKGADPE